MFGFDFCLCKIKLFIFIPIKNLMSLDKILIFFNIIWTCIDLEKWYVDTFFPYIVHTHERETKEKRWDG
jgi:hypothetical protein